MFFFCRACTGSTLQLSVSTWRGKGHFMLRECRLEFQFGIVLPVYQHSPAPISLPLDGLVASAVEESSSFGPRCGLVSPALPRTSCAPATTCSSTSALRLATLPPGHSMRRATAAPARAEGMRRKGAARRGAHREVRGRGEGAEATPRAERGTAFTPAHRHHWARACACFARLARHPLSPVLMTTRIANHGTSLTLSGARPSM